MSRATRSGVAPCVAPPHVAPWARSSRWRRRSRAPPRCAPPSRPACLRGRASRLAAAAASCPQPARARAQAAWTLAPARRAHAIRRDVPRRPPNLVGGRRRGGGAAEEGAHRFTLREVGRRVQRRPPELIGRVHVPTRLVKRPQAARRAGTSGVEGGGGADVVGDVGGGARSKEEAQRLRRLRRPPPGASARRRVRRRQRPPRAGRGVLRAPACAASMSGVHEPSAS